MATKIHIICFTGLLMIFYLIIHPVSADAQSTWAHAYGGSNDDYAYSIQQTSDGGFIVAGQTDSFGAGADDIFVLKLNSSGTITWQKTYGGSATDIAYYIKQTTDGGYIVVGQTDSLWDSRQLRYMGT